MNHDRAEVDELILEIADYKNDYAGMAIEKLFGSARPVGKTVQVSLIQLCDMASGRPVLWKLVPHIYCSGEKTVER